MVADLTYFLSTFERRIELLSGLLPQARLLHPETWQIDPTTGQVTLRVQSTQTLMHCPMCRFSTRRIYSCYQRTVADLPWAHYRVVWQLSVRKFFCTNGRYLRRIFTERLPGIVAPGPSGQSASCTGSCPSPWPWAGQQAHSSASAWAWP
jgi:hypothetical protein